MVSIHAHSSWQRLREVVIVVLAFTLVAFGTVAMSMKAPVSHAAASIPATTYGCGTSNGHCYGLNDWPGGINGAATSEYVVLLTCNGGGGCIMNNTMWIANHGDCTFPPGNIGAQWIETGFTEQQQYYWADVNNSCQYNFWSLGAIPNGSNGCNDFNAYANFQIYRLSSSAFGIIVSSGCFYHTGTSTDQSNLNPNDINTGEEGAFCCWSAPKAWYKNNQWEGTNNVWHYQTVDGSLKFNNPPWVGWESSSTHPHNTNYGGLLWTHS
jgi:hypothetical protein